MTAALTSRGLAGVLFPARARSIAELPRATFQWRQPLKRMAEPRNQSPISHDQLFRKMSEVISLREQVAQAELSAPDVVSTVASDRCDRCNARRSIRKTRSLRRR